MSFPITFYSAQIEAIGRIFERRGVLGPGSRNFLVSRTDIDPKLPDAELVAFSLKKLSNALTLERITKRLTA